MKKPILVILVLLASVKGSYSFFPPQQELGNGEKVICTFRGVGADPVYEIRCRVGNSTKIEIPGELRKTIVDDKEDWLIAEGRGTVIVQPAKTKSSTYINIILRVNDKLLTLCFKLVEVTGKSSSPEFDEHVQVIIEDL